MEGLKTIEGLVHNHFYLKSSSNFRFSEAIYNRFVDELYKPYMDEDYRIKVELPPEYYATFDKGWQIFKNALPEFIENYDIEYQDFRKNKILQNKNTIKIFKLLKNYFLEKDFVIQSKLDEYQDFLRFFMSIKVEVRELIQGSYDLYTVNTVEKIIKMFIDTLNEVRFSTDKNMYAVLSLNFIDMFLSSTGEDWSSCLNLESYSYAAYWASLPGMAVDKNLAMFYITNGSEKYYEGVVSPKILSRSFVLLDNNGVPNIVKFYPNEIVNIDTINKFFPFKFKKIDESFVSKYDIDPLKYKDNKTVYLYQDKTHPVPNRDGTFYLKYGGKGLYTFLDENKYFEGPIFNWTGGFKELKDRKISFDRRRIEPIRCNGCNKLISGSRGKEFEGNLYCQNCYDDLMEQENLFNCSNCGIGLHEDEVLFNEFDEPYCQDCY